MKVSFLFVSIALHAAALSYPALFPAARDAEPVVVSLIVADGGSGGSRDGGRGGRSAAQKKIPRRREGNGSSAKAAPAEARAENTFPAPLLQAEAPRELPASEPEKPQLETAPPIVAPVVTAAPSPAVPGAQRETNVIAIVGSGSAASRSESTSAARTGAPGGPASAGNAANGGSVAAGVGSDTGRGGGSGKGDGSGSGDRSGSGASFVDARYDYCPRPDTPEIARRNRWNGTVTLRVFIDERGKPQSLEVNRSSGFAVLDEAAIETVKTRCRFHPARDGEKRVTTWIRIPVVFPLAD